MRRQVWAAAAVVLGLSMISPEAVRAEAGATQEYREADGGSGEFQLAKVKKPKRKRKA